MSAIIRRAVAATELLLVGPAILFVAALFVRSIQSQELEPARSANQVVMWYVGLGPKVGLWGLLITLPLAVLCLGGATMLQSWATGAELRSYSGPNHRLFPCLIDLLIEIERPQALGLRHFRWRVTWFPDWPIRLQTSS